MGIKNWFKKVVEVIEKIGKRGNKTKPSFEGKSGMATAAASPLLDETKSLNNAARGPAPARPSEKPKNTPEILAEIAKLEALHPGSVTENSVKQMRGLAEQRQAQNDHNSGLGGH